eukprot:1913838-Amphidinium_carterae.1
MFLLVSYHADLAEVNWPCIELCIGLELNAVKPKMQAPQMSRTTKRLLCSFETQNMSDGCSAVVIHAGGCRG